MKKFVSIISVVLMMSFLCMPAFASESTQTDLTDQEKQVVTNVSECTEEEYIAALAQERGVTLEEARQIHQDERSTNNVRSLPFSEKYYQIEQQKYVQSGYYLTCMATAYVLVDNGNFGHVCEVLDVISPYVTMSGQCSNVQWSGSTEPRITTEDIRVFANGEIFFDISTDISVSGGAFVNVGTGSGSTNRYRYFAQEQFYWGLSDI